MIEAVLFDNDGVLVDTESLYLEAGRETLGSALAGGELAWVLETGDQIGGVAIATRRALLRARGKGEGTSASFC